LVENAIEPLFTTAHPNDPIPLGEYNLELRIPKLIFSKGNIEFRWGIRNSSVFELDPITGTDVFRLSGLVNQLDQNVILNVSTTPPISWDVIITKSQVETTTGGPSSLNLSGLIQKTRFNDDVGDVLCDELKFHIVNLHAYYGTPITYPSNPNSLWRRRIVLNDNDWEIIIDGVENCDKLLDELKRGGGFGITHVGVLRNKEKRPFKVAEALKQIDQLGLDCTPVSRQVVK
jgi:hypothetical protein